MENTAAIRLIQFISPRKYVQDMLYVSLLLIFFYRETSIPLPYVVVVSVLLTAISAILLFNRIPYSSALAVVQSFFWFSLILFMGGSVFFYFVLTALSIWRLHIRFATVQYEGAYDWPFIGVLSGLYIPLAGICIFGGLNDELSLLTILSILGVFISVAGRLLEQWLKAERERKVLKNSAIVLTAVALVGSAGYLIFKYLGEYIRLGIEWLIVKTIGLFLPFIGTLLENPVNWIRGFLAKKLEEKNQKTLLPEDPVTSDQQSQVEIPTGASDFPWLPLFIGGAAIILMMVVIHIWRNRPEFDAIQQTDIQVKRESLDLMEEEETEKWLYSMDVHQVREAFIEFEKEASRGNLGRHREETVREWFLRMDWSIDPRFFRIYDSVRYGRETIPETDGRWFIDQLSKIIEKN